MRGVAQATTIMIKTYRSVRRNETSNLTIWGPPIVEAEGGFRESRLHFPARLHQPVQYTPLFLFRELRAGKVALKSHYRFCGVRIARVNGFDGVVHACKARLVQANGNLTVRV